MTNAGKTLFAQLMDFLPWTTFARYVARYEGDKGVRSLTCVERVRAMVFAPLTWRESLRDSGASCSGNALPVGMNIRLKSALADGR